MIVSVSVNFILLAFVFITIHYKMIYEDKDEEPKLFAKGRLTFKKIFIIKELIFSNYPLID